MLQTAPPSRLLATALATTGLWLFQLGSSLVQPDVVGKLSAPVAARSSPIS
jgi:hypothetical protein